ncbi:hypothetical protein B566_EDAN004017 [Ephemera danica]|nr:hypothetical protein B566_EDAN004017 [Ephemera danica]
MAQKSTDFDDLDLELASDHTREVHLLEEEPVSKILLPSLGQRKLATIKINLQNPGVGKKTPEVVTLEPPEVEEQAPSPPVFPQPSLQEPRPSGPRFSVKNLKPAERSAELRKLYAQTYLDDEKRSVAVFCREKSHGFRIVCRVCKTSCTSEINLLEHANGRRHISNVTEQQNKMANQGNLNLAPGEPVPPGFEDEIKRVPMCQEMLDSFKDSPLLGLEYLVELMGDDEESGRMVCFLCDKTASNLSPTTRQNIISHFIGTTHRIAYLKRHFPLVYETINKVTNDRGRKMDSGRLAKMVAANIEEDYGRLRPMAVDRTCYYCKVYETPEKTYVDIVNPPLSPERKRDVIELEGKEFFKFATRSENGPGRSGPSRSERENLKSSLTRQRSGENSESRGPDFPAKKKQRVDDPLRDTTPISLSSDTLSLSSSSGSRSRSPGHRKHPSRNRSPGHYRRPPFEPDSRHDPRHYSRYPRGPYHNSFRGHRSRTPPYKHSRSGSPKRYQRRSRSPSYRQRRRSRSRSPVINLGMNRQNSGSMSPQILGPRHSPIHRSQSPSIARAGARSSIERRIPTRSMSRSRSPSIQRSGSPSSMDHRAPWQRGNSRLGLGRVGRHEKSPTPEQPLTKRDKWTKFREEADNLELEMEELRQFHKKNPEKHPLYKDEWKKFWNRRYQELQSQGKDPNKHDYKPEWITFWNQKMEDMHMEEFRTKKDSLKKKLELSDEDEPVYKQRPRIVRAPPDDQMYGYAGRDPGYHAYDHPGGPVSDMRDTWKAYTGGDIRTEPPLRPRSPSWAPPNRFRGPQDDSSYYNPHSDGTYKVIAVLRMLTALEGQLGSFGPKINALLAQSISMEKCEYGSSQDLIRNIDNVVLFESIKEKFKGMLMAGIVERGNVKATRVAIADMSELLNRAPPPIKPEAPPPSKPATMTSAVTSAAAPAIEVPGVGEMDRAALAIKISEALVAQGKTDATEEELMELVEAVIGMSGQSEQPQAATSNAEPSEKPKEAVKTGGKKEEQEAKATITEATQKSDALKVLQAAYKRPSPVKKEEKRPPLNNVAQISDLNESELKDCLRIYKDLSANEQRSLIMYLRKLEEQDPGRTEYLRKYVNLGKGNNPEDTEEEEEEDDSKNWRFGDGPTSPFSSRRGGANPSLNEPIDSDDDYSFEDVCKAAVRNVDERQKATEEDQRKKIEELKKQKQLNKPADNSAIIQAIEATTDTMIANLRDSTSSRKDSVNLSPAPQKEQDLGNAWDIGPRISVQVGQRGSTLRQVQQTPAVRTVEVAQPQMATSNQMPAANYMLPGFGMQQQQQQTDPYLAYQQQQQQNIQYPQMGQYQQQQPQGFGSEPFYQYNQQVAAQQPFGFPQQQQQQQQHQQNMHPEMSYHPAQYSASYEKRQNMTRKW